MEFRVLGPLEVADDGRTLQVPGGKARALLAILLLNANRVVSTDRLIDLMWGDEPPATADKALQVHISQLRKALSPDDPGSSPIKTRPPGYLLALEARLLDLLYFSELVDEGRRAAGMGDVRLAAERLHAALALWRGSPLSDFTFEPFAHTEIARLEELRLEATEERVEADLELGRHAEVVAELEMLVRDHPLRERLRAHLILALYRCGRQADALAIYDEGRRILGDELGIDPGPALQKLHRRILEQDRGLEPQRITKVPHRGPGGRSIMVVASPAGQVHDAAQLVAGAALIKAGDDGFVAEFDDPVTAVNGALGLLDRLVHAGTSPLPRIVVESGEIEAGDRSTWARLLQLGYPGQLLVGRGAADYLFDALPPETALRDLGEHRLLDLSRRERVFQIAHPDLPSDFPPLRSSDATPNNLTLQLTSFVGRRGEMDEVKRLLDDSRLVTLTGSGGCGKSRLALHIGAELVPQYPDGVWLVELADVTTPQLTAAAVTATLGIAEHPERNHVEALIDHARARSLLLILDNCEHLVDACVELVVAVLGSCSGVRVIATSREVFAVPGEAVLRVPSLGIPSEEADFGSLVDYESVRLFEDRASAVAPDFVLDEESAPAVVQICRRLDGLPLAIELAAARLRSMTVDDVAAHLGDRFRLLTGGRRGSISRHQTLRAVMDWSFNLLPEDEAILLGRLSVFAGGFNLAAAEGICTNDRVPPGLVLDLLARLVDKSLVSIERGERGWRYRLLETVREYAWERLIESGDAMRGRERHASFFLDLAEHAEHEMQGPDLSRWADQLEAERDNFRAALTWFEEESLGADQMRLAAALWRYCYLRGRYRQGREWLDAALKNTHDIPPQLRANALYGAGALAFFECDYDDAYAYCSQALRLYADIGDELGTGRTLNRLGSIARERADYDRARELHEQSLAAFRKVGDEWEIANSLQLAGLSAWLSGDFERARTLSGDSVDRARALDDNERTAWALLDLGAVAHYAGEPDRAIHLLTESLNLFEDVGFKEGIAWARNLLGLHSLKQGDRDRARHLLAESLSVHAELNDRWRAASVLEALAAVLTDQGSPTLACRLLGCAGRLRETIGSPVPWVERRDRDATEDALRAGLGGEAFEEARQQGAALTVEEALGALSAASA
jgi:predicted ATPase/DNA-binding SARP family transcriptional activator